MEVLSLENFKSNLEKVTQSIAVKDLVQAEEGLLFLILSVASSLWVSLTFKENDKKRWVSERRD